MAQRKPKPHPGYMIPLRNPRQRLTELDAEIRQHLKRCRVLCAPPSQEPDAAVRALALLRREVYEDLNQLLHQSLIVKTAIHLKAQPKYRTLKLEWWHHPKQTSAPQEPDLRGVAAGRIRVSAEITSSLNPQGVIRTRIHDKITRMRRELEGDIFFVTASDEMAIAARNAIADTEPRIEVITLHLLHSPSRR